MTIRIIRAGEHIQHIPGWGMSIRESGVAVAAAGNWWEVSGKTCVAAYQPKGAASLATSYVNLANPGTYDAAPGTAPTFDTATGWTFNGSTQYLTSGINPSGGWTMFVAFNSASASGYIAGRRVASGINEFTILPIGAVGERLVKRGSSYARVAGGAITSGVYGLSGDTGYLNGVADPGILSGSLTLTIPIYIGAPNNNGVPGFGLVSTVTAFVVYSDALTSGEVATLSTAMAAL